MNDGDKNIYLTDKHTAIPATTRVEFHQLNALNKKLQQ